MKEAIEELIKKYQDEYNELEKEHWGDEWDLGNRVGSKHTLEQVISDLETILKQNQ